MDQNLALIIGLASGVAFLNIVLFSLWYLWEQKRRKRKDLQRDKLTSLSHRPRKLVKRNRPSPPAPAHTLPEKYDTHPYSPPIRNSEPIYLPSPYDFPQSPKHRTVRALGLSPLRNELYAPSIQRKNSTESNDTASIYSTMSAPRHLHEELLSESHSSFMTVDTLDTVNTLVEKYGHSAYNESPPISTGSGSNASYFMQDIGPQTYEPTHIRYPTAYQCNLTGLPPNRNTLLQQWPATPEVKRHMCSVLPFHTMKPSFKPLAPVPEQLSPILDEDLPSRLRSPYSP